MAHSGGLLFSDSMILMFESLQSYEHTLKYKLLIINSLHNQKHY